MELLNLLTVDSVSLTVPASLDSISTRVLLEQETWLEKELSFLRQWPQSGMTMLDIAAIVEP
jgi:hypothetical protein